MERPNHLSQLRGDARKRLENKSMEATRAAVDVLVDQAVAGAREQGLRTNGLPKINLDAPTAPTQLRRVR